MGLANIFRICGVLFILFAAGLFLGAIILSESYFDETDTDDHIKHVKQMALIISSLGVGTGILFLLSSFIKDVNSSPWGNRSKLIASHIIRSYPKCLL